jgi:gliding motility-associated-like protein
VVTINPLPPVTATPSFAICPGASATLSGGGASTYTWDNGITNGTPFSPIATKTYTVTGTDVNGCKNTATSVVTINPLPTVTATPSFAICTGASATLSGAGASTYIWDNGITNGTAFSPIATKTYTVTGTDANGCKNTATSVVTIKVIPNSPLVTNPAAICQFSTAPNLITSVTGANLNWYDVALGGTALGSAPIASSLTVGKFDHWVSQTIDGCESAREIVTYQINSAPSIPIVTPQYNICQNNAVPIISVNTGGNTANWYTTATGSTAQNATPIISSATIGQKSHWVSAIALGCESLRAKIDINVLANPDLSAIVPALICQGDTLNVNLSFSGMAPFNLLYSNTGHNGNIISAKSDFTFYLLPDVDGNVEFITLTDSNCVTSYNNYINNFFVNQLPKLSLQGFDTICDKQFIDIEFKSDLLSANYAWTVSQSNTAIKVLNNFSNGIEIKQQLQNLLQSVQEIKYTVTAYNGNCIGESKSKVITVMPSYLPSLNDTMPTVCKGSSLVLDAGNSPVGYKTQWYKNDVIMNNELSTKLPIVVNDNDFYKIVATNYCGVEDEASTSVSIYDRQHLTQLKTIDSCATFVSAFEINTGTLLDNTKWTIENNVYDDKVVNQKSNMNHTFLDVSIYDLSIQGYYGTCLLADTSFKFKTVDCSVKLTNTFTPNGDQANDWWYISGIENFPNASIDIFNRWGIKIKSINKNIPNLAWDGYNSEGQLMENGTYYYVLRFDMGKQPIKGYINLLR